MRRRPALLRAGAAPAPSPPSWPAPLRGAARRGLVAAGLLTALLLCSCAPRGSSTLSAPLAAAAAAGAAVSSQPAHASAAVSGQDAAALSSPGAGRSAVPSAAGSRPPGGSLAYVSFVAGKVLALNSGEGTVHSEGAAVQVGDPVGEGESLVTDAGSLAEVRVGNSYDVALAHGSVLRFDHIAPPAGAPGAEPFRLALSLRRGSVIVKAGAGLLESPQTSTAAAPPAAGPLLLEVRTPNLFLSARGGTLLVTDAGDGALCAVGPGNAWVLPRAVVYTDIIGRVATPAVALLNGILAKAVLLPRHSEVTVLPARLASIEEMGSAIREILTATEGKTALPAPTLEALTGLARKAAFEVAAAIGGPRPLSPALLEELDPQSVVGPKMATTSETVNGVPVGSSGTAGPAGAAQQAASSSQAGGVPASSAGTSSLAAGSPVVAAGAAPASAQQTQGGASAGGPSGEAAAGAGPAAGSGSLSSAASESFPGPTSPTPPTPPTPPLPAR